MASQTSSLALTDWSAMLPEVRLEVRQGNGRTTTYSFAEVDFLIGSLPGCDLRVAGTEPQTLLCVLARHPGGVTLRKLSPTQTILVNSRNASHLDLENDDRLQMGLLEMRICISPPRSTAKDSAELEQAGLELQQRVNAFREQVVLLQQERETLAKERQEFARRIDEQDRDCGESWQAQHTTLMEEIQQRDRSLAEQASQLAQKERALQQLRQDMTSLRAQKQQEDHQRREIQDALQTDLERRTIELAQRMLRFEEDCQDLERREKELQDARAQRQTELEQREQALAQQKLDLETRLKIYEADVLRLNRWQGTLEERDRELQQRTEETSLQREQLQKESAEMETQLLQIDEWRTKLNDEADRLAARKQEQDLQTRELAERTAALEGQQTTLSALRARIERMREEIRTAQQRLDEQQLRQDMREGELSRKTQDMQQRQQDIENQQKQYEQDRQQWLQRSAVMETAVRQLKQAQENLAVEDERVRREAAHLAEKQQIVQETEGILNGRLTQLAEAQEHQDAERNSLRERSVNLVQREQACEALQEQLRRRSEEISARQKELADQLQEQQAKFAAFAEERVQLHAREQQSREQLETWRLDLEQKAAALQQHQADAAGFEERHQQMLNQIALERKTLADEQVQFQREQRAALEKLAQSRAEFETMRDEAQELILHLPDAELRASTAMERLAHARTQMREHLTEIHRYVRQCQDELELVRGRLQADFDKLQQEEQTLRRSQDEQRLAMVEFRQQLIDWQGQIAELKRLLTHDETRLERKKAQVDERTREMEAESERLAKQAEELDQQERDVADLRLEMDRHLVEMREWYRHKLRDLAGIPLTPDALGGAAQEDESEGNVTVLQDGEPALVPTGRSILSITSPVDAGDRALGQVLREAQLIDADTLRALLAEARRQRRSLRQVLLSSGVITLYQLALIEAGNTSGLMLGPVRVIDRLRNTAHESVYRVFDPRRGTEAVLRHLAEADMTDATRPDEFRQRFAQAMLNDIHLANTLEVFELLGRPAVLQEWLSGLPATDWPPLTAAPGVCYRLLTQAAQGLATAHRAGVIHGHLGDSLLLLTSDGVLKITGLGEPPWLIGLVHDEEPTPQNDLRMLGTIVSGWCTPTGVRKGAKTKPLPDALISVLYRLAAEGDAGYADVQELLAELEKAAADIPPNAEAWDRLLKYIREHGGAEAMLRQSA